MQGLADVLGSPALKLISQLTSGKLFLMCALGAVSFRRISTALQHRATWLVKRLVAALHSKWRHQSVGCCILLVLSMSLHMRSRANWRAAYFSAIGSIVAAGVYRQARLCVPGGVLLQ